MAINKAIRFIYLVFSILAISTLFTVIDVQSTELSPFKLGFSVGQLFGHLIKVVLMLVLMVAVIRHFKVENLFLLVMTVLGFSLIFSLVSTYSTNVDAYRFGQKTGEIFGNMIRNIVMLGLIVITIKLFRLNNRKTNT